MLIDRQEIKLSESQLRLVKSGWGKETVENAVVEKIVYVSDDLKVNGYLARPADNSTKYPCVIWNRGGIGENGAIDQFTARGIYGQLASWGYVVFASQYRGNAGSEGKDEFGGSDVNDVLNLVPLADEVPEADTSIWGIEGWSRGGMMTYLALTRTKIFKTAVVSGGIADLRCNARDSRYMRDLYQRAMGSYESPGFDELCKSRSIVNFTEQLPETTPLLMLHGTGDKRVSPKDSIDLSVKLLERNFPFRLILFENGDHFLKSHRREVDEIRRKWFSRYLKNNGG